LNQTANVEATNSAAFQFTALSDVCHVNVPVAAGFEEFWKLPCAGQSEI